MSSDHKYKEIAYEKITPRALIEKKKKTRKKKRLKQARDITIK